MKYMRIFFAVVVIAAVVLIAPNAVGAWNARVQQEPVAVKPAAGLQLNTRPAGTVIGNPWSPISNNVCTLLGSYCLTSSQSGLLAEAITELPLGVPTPAGETLVLTRLVQVMDTVGGRGKLEVDLEFTLEPPLASGEEAEYWDGTKWVELEAINGKFIIPAGVKLPIVIAVCK